MGKKKTEGGSEFSSSAYLVVPDPEEPSTWKLRVEETPGKVTTAQLGRAAAALGPGFRGNKVNLSNDQRASALRKLRGLYKSHGASGDDLPSVLQQASVLVAGHRLRRNAEALLATLGEDRAAVRAEIAEDLEALQESLYSYGIAAMQNGTLSFEAMCQAVADSVNEIEDGDEREGQDPMHTVLATFPGSAVYQGEDGGLYQVSYHMEGTEAVIEGEPVQVTAEFNPVEGTPQETQEAALAESVNLVESRPIAPIRGGKLNRETNTIEGTTLITGRSSNGANHKRKYSANALQQIAGMAEGLPAFANHVAPDQAFKPRDVRDLIGRHVNVRYDAARDRVTSDLQLLEHHAPWVFSLAERMGDQVGNSLVSKGLVRMEGDGTEVVDEIIALRSGDLVSDPASTKGLFEAAGSGEAGTLNLREDREIFEAAHTPGQVLVGLRFPKDVWESATQVRAWAALHGFKVEALQEAEDAFRLPQAEVPTTASRTTRRLTPDTDAALVEAVITTTQEASDMEFTAANIATYLKEHTDVLGQVAGLLEFVPKADHVKLQESADAIGKEKATLIAERDGLKSKVDGFEAKEAVAAKRARLQEAIEKHDLTKQFGKVKAAVSDVFVGTLMEADESKWGGLLDERVALLKDVPAGQRPRSDGGSDKESVLSEAAGGLPEGIHARLAAAIQR